MTLEPGLGMTVLERGWLSSNQVVFAESVGSPSTVVDTGFSGHSTQTLALVDHALDGAPLRRIVNTHLHSDHCGGNSALQARGDVETWIPAASVETVRRWDAPALTFELTGQPCPRFRVDHALVPGSSLSLGDAEWMIHSAPGHDMEAIILFEPQSRTLIAGDALWESRLAIIFPELAGESGFGAARDTLAMIERLAPRVVVPGHGAPFEDVASALAASRGRLDGFEARPERHAQHAARALLMFHMLEVRRSSIDDVLSWMARTTIYRHIARQAGVDISAAAAWHRDSLERLVGDGVLVDEGGTVGVAPG